MHICLSTTSQLDGAGENDFTVFGGWCNFRVMSGRATILRKKLRRSKGVRPDKPDLPKWLFWEVRYEMMDWRWSHRFVITRVLDRGTDEQLAELIRFYGLGLVRNTLKKKCIFLMDHSIQRACTYFKLQPEELRCYIRKRSRPGHWL